MYAQELGCQIGHVLGRSKQTKVFDKELVPFMLSSNSTNE
jgi:hypothetical protein